MNEVTLNKIRALIASADGLIISAGAGIGVDSGLPDFRGNEGMWEHYPHWVSCVLVLAVLLILKPLPKIQNGHGDFTAIV